MPDRIFAVVFSNSFLLSAIYTHTHILQVCMYHSVVMFLHADTQAAGRGRGYRPITVQLTCLCEARTVWTEFCFCCSVIVNHLISATLKRVLFVLLLDKSLLTSGPLTLVFWSF